MTWVLHNIINYFSHENKVQDGIFHLWPHVGTDFGAPGTSDLEVKDAKPIITFSLEGL